MAPSVMGGYGSNQTAGNGGMSVVAIVLLALIVLLATRKSPRRRTQPRTT